MFNVYGKELETAGNSHSFISSGTCCVFGPAEHEIPEAVNVRDHQCLAT
jgi:hypothetical protein